MQKISSNFEGTKILVTGGTRGIGEATALAFRDQGANVAVGARSPASFQEFVARNGDQNIFPAIGTVGSSVECHQVVDAALEVLGGELDILVNNAGFFAEVPTEDVDQAHWDNTINTNLAGVFFCVQAALPSLRASNGVIINVASDAGLIGYPQSVVYSASKGGVVNMTRALALELAPEIRTNCICPGNVQTDMIVEAAKVTSDADTYLEEAHDRSPLGRMARPEEVANAILFLASPNSTAINGAILSIDGGGVCGF